MPDDIQTLTDLNIQIGIEEPKGQAARPWFDRLIAEKFAFMRADKSMEDRGDFLNIGLKPGPARGTRIDEIAIYGNRAVVSCIVRMGEKQYHNLRLFIREKEDAEWKLLAWANEEAKAFWP
jgi:hypothetical protein